MARTGSYPLLPSFVVREAFVCRGTEYAPLGSVYSNPQYWLAFPVHSRSSVAAYGCDTVVCGCQRFPFNKQTHHVAMESTPMESAVVHMSRKLRPVT